jgi:uncharacterized RDD family membrane protein YckC
VYLAPDGSYSATYPSVRRRLAAGAIDWVLCWVIFLVASIVGGIVQGAGAVSFDAGDRELGVALLLLGQLVVAGPVVAYFAHYWRQGSTLGMRAADIDLVREETGEPPGWSRTIPRAIVACLLALALLNVYLAFGGRVVDEFGRFERVLAVVSAAVAAAGLAAKAWLVVDDRRRSALDRLFGLLYVEEVVYADAGPSPWLDGFRESRSS